MYHALAKHGGMSLTMKCKGDLWIDDHHTADEYSHMCSRITDQYIRCIYKIAQSPLERLSRKLLVKSAEFVDTELDLHPWMRWVTDRQRCTCPFDYFQALSRAVIDICSRPYCVTDLGLKREKIGDLSTEMIPHIFYSFAIASGVTLHVDVLRGENDHHRCVCPMLVNLATALSQQLQIWICIQGTCPCYQTSYRTHWWRRYPEY